MVILYLITARAGSKGLPGKNTKLLHNKPLVSYSIDLALQCMQPGDKLCISTDDVNVIQVAEEKGISVPFVRPAALCTDTATSYDVIMHAINFYEKTGLNFDAVMLLQPTSPLRDVQDVNNVLNAFDDNCDMVATVKISKENPYFTLFEEDELGFLKKSKSGNYSSRQAAPPVYCFNGALYLLKTASLKRSDISAFDKIKKIIMPEERSVDIDTPADWILAEYFFNVNNK